MVASKLLIETDTDDHQATIGALDDSHLFCRFKRKFSLDAEGLSRIHSTDPKEHEFMIFPMNQHYQLMLAKGNAEEQSIR